MDLVTVDALGRVLLPKRLREAAGLHAGSQMLAMKVGDKVVLEPWDAETIARRLHEELKGVDIDAIVKQVRAEVDELAEREADRILGGRERVRGRRQRGTQGERIP